MKNEQIVNPLYEKIETSGIIYAMGLLKIEFETCKQSNQIKNYQTAQTIEDFNTNLENLTQQMLDLIEQFEKHEALE